MPVESALDIVSKASEGVGFSIVKDWANDLIARYELEMTQGPGDMSGESSALFDYNGVQLRLKRTWMKQYLVYKGPWKPDPHWTGD